MSKFRKKGVAAGLGLAISASAAYASCGGTEAMVVLETETLVKIILDKMLDGASIVNQMSLLSTNRTLSAMKVVVKQHSSSSEKKMLALRGAGEGLATVYSSQKSSEQVYDIYNRYRSQGFDPCGTSALTKQIKALEVKSGAAASQRIASEIDAAPGRFADPAAVLQGRLQEHKQLFCTQQEKDAGVCSSVGALPGGDSNASLLFKDALPTAIETKAKNAFINNLFGLPPAPNAYVGKENTPEAQVAMSDRHRVDALNSVAMFSMKTIQSDHEIDSTTGKSLAGALKERVGMYFGTPVSQKWAQSLAAQEQRGVLVDMVKMEGIALKLAQRRITQNARIEGNLAGLVALSTEQLQRQ
jgi:hypothetical protein